jgi:hypothetical protein
MRQVIRLVVFWHLQSSDGEVLFLLGEPLRGGGVVYQSIKPELIRRSA